MIEIGIDIENIDRFKKYNLENNSDFLRTIFSEKELEYCFSTKSSAKHLTARFCGKEAFIKAVSDLDINLNFNQIEIFNKENGKPYLNLPDIEILNKYEFKISISHEKNYAVATVILSTRDNNGF